MLGMIYAVSPEGVIGIGNKIPWRYPGDFRRFKRITMGAAVVMGRKTFESLGKPLPGRRNIVVTRSTLDAPGIECAPSLEEAIARAGDADVWLIGGARIYEDGMNHADLIDVTYVPDRGNGPDAVHAPPIDEQVFEPGPLLPHEDEPGLTRRVYRRRTG
jgi:dihydrofolate reductase